LSRKDKRTYDAALERLRSQGENVSKSPERLRRNKRDRAVTFILALAGIGLTFYKVMWASTAFFVGLLFFADLVGNSEQLVKLSKPKIRATQLATIAFGVFLGILVLYPLWRQEQAAAFEGDLIGAGPAIDDGKQHGFPMLQIGGSTLIMTPNGIPEIFKLYPDASIKVEWGYKGPLFTTNVRDRNGNLIADVSRNRWRVYPPYFADKNYTQTALEVKDSAGHVVLQVQILPDRIDLQGEWWDTQGNGIRFLKPRVVTPAAGSMVIHLGPRDQHNESLIQPMFQYPSKDHWRELAQ
jgi:hypothetical protein